MSFMLLCVSVFLLLSSCSAFHGVPPSSCCSSRSSRNRFLPLSLVPSLYNQARISSVQPLSTTSDKSATGRRRRRHRQGQKQKPPQLIVEETKITMNEEGAQVKDDETSTSSMIMNSSCINNEEQGSGDGTSNLEDLFGLGNEQLRELMEQELPVPREDLVTKQEASDIEEGKVFQLPDLNEFLEKTSLAKKKAKSLSTTDIGDDGMRVNRSNQDEYMRVMQLNPFADADNTLFEEEYDMFTSYFGSGKLLGIPIPYLQTGHGMLLIISLLAGFIYAPGNPLTEFPSEIRHFIKDGLLIVYSINSVLAMQAFLKAREKNLPGLFWGLKSFLLGGVAFYEITQAKDPTKRNIENKSFLSDRKSTSSRSNI